jgi:hypothetical protein
MSGRGRSQASIDLIDTAHDILEVIQPASVRSVCYQLFTRGVITSMKVGETQKVSRLLVRAREEGTIPWEWIVDETRAPETIAAWNDLPAYGRAVLKSYRKDFWQNQTERVEVWSEKGTVRGVLAPVLDQYAVTFSVKHGFDSATSVNAVADQTVDMDRPLIALYVGDYDPSGLCMSEVDLPRRLDEYGANVRIERIALTEEDITSGIPSFDVETKHGDPRYRWFRDHYGNTCWELDALSPAILRERVSDAIASYIDDEAWDRCARVEAAEREGLAALDWKSILRPV